MKLLVRFLPQAEIELLHEVNFYSKAREGTGVRFQSAVEIALERASQRPFGGTPSPHGTRSVLVKGFPFSIVYRTHGSELQVVAVAHHRRRPEYWLFRVSDV